MANVQKSGCLCGASRFEIIGEGEFTIQCYCRDCQHVSGGGNLPQYVVKRNAVRMTGPIKTHCRKSEAGNDLMIGFCSDCGSPLFKTTSRASDKTFVTAGALDDPTIFSDSKRVYEDSRQPWDKS
jgi:hypothetical protein